MISCLSQTVPVSCLLVLGSILNAVYLFSRMKLYRMHRRKEAVSSPNAAFVSAKLDIEPPSLGSRVASRAWHAFSTFWRFLLGMSGPAENTAILGKVIELNVWNPGEMERRLICLYSPAHSLLWMATNSANWMMIMIIMVIVGTQVSGYNDLFNLMIYNDTGSCYESKLRGVVKRQGNYSQ
jgi:hypothetical protein